MAGEWKTLNSKELFAAGLFRLRVDQCELPDKRIMPKYYVLEFPAWVHVVALTADRELIMLKQYRYAAQVWCLEIPGGSTDYHEVEDPLLAVKRELGEETGYEAASWHLLGQSYPNPALQNNAIFTYLAKDCKKVKEPKLDPYEVLEVQLMPVAEVYKLLESGGIKHALMVSALALARPHLLGTT